ncbi:serine/threonine-protein kinase [Anaeromyxobacter sp. Fw109-5]|uniref:serine/threonine-protein kinase n=1 Tax=Anaeromyxobacter sp. (strain Fw109-5) TaxID=404589 RepID=UPI0000ED7D13|nr:serine/threonine-protein kinase [Anaeromyxobacter sp. Fw109-5]ABS25603.1 protein kinase [Anaeromyxobacter sp. Fw109-5]
MRPFGKYRLLEPLASGGMADVWRAEVSLAAGVVKEVALKLVRGEHEADGDFVRMFIEEARLASRLGHANVVQVFEFDQVDGRYYIAMELVRGHHLGRVVERARERGERLGLARAVHLGAEVAKALAYAHRLSEGGRPLGLVHRDVSPHNVLVSFEGEVKLADFGIARAMGQAGLTAPGTLKGKLAYMAPEQARGEAVDARADVFALGVVLWELCAGRRLFARESEAATLGAVLEDAAVSPPSAWNEEVPPELDAAVLGALERDPARRTRSAEDLARALADVLLRITRSAADVDLRTFMHRLWPEGPAAARPPERTRVRPVPVAAEPVAGATRVSAPAAAVLAAEASARGDDEEAATRTVPPAAGEARRSRRSRPVAIAIAVVAAAALLAGALLLRGGSAASRAASTDTAGHAPAAPERTPPPAGAGGPSPAPTPAPQAAPVLAAPAQLEPAAPPARVSELAPLPAVETLRIAARLNGLAVPPASSGHGVLGVNAVPWGTVFVNGVRVGETPLDVRLPAGRYRVRVEHPKGADTRVIDVAPGRRTQVLARPRAR